MLYAHEERTPTIEDRTLEETEELNDEILTLTVAPHVSDDPRYRAQGLTSQVHSIQTWHDE